MTTADMLALLKQRTKVADQSKLLIELRSAYRWAARRVFNSEGGPDLLVTIGEELTALASTTRTYDLAAHTASGVLGIKELWVKLPGDTRFTPMRDGDNVDLDDSSTSADPDLATGHPVYYYVYNDTSLRFPKALPATSVIRADYFKTGEPPDPTTNPTVDAATDLPEAFHDGICSKAIAQLYGMLDDDREGSYETRARDELGEAIYQKTKRVQGPTKTKPFNARFRRVSNNGL